MLVFLFSAGLSLTSLCCLYVSFSGFYLYEHKFKSGKRFVSIRWSGNSSFALAEENGKLHFKVSST